MTQKPFQLFFNKISQLEFNKKWAKRELRKVFQFQG